MRHPLTLFLAVALACTSDPTAPASSPAGEWYGAETHTTPATTLSLSLTVTGSTVRGTGALNDIPITVTGTFTSSTATLTLSAGARPPVVYTVTVLAPTSMGGRLTGGGLGQYPEFWRVYTDAPLFVDRR